MSEHRLDVFHESRPVGTIGFESLEEAFTFAYEPGWMGDREAFPLSPHFLSGIAVASGTIRRFLENLLPEGRALDVASTTHQVSKNNVFGLVRELGRETAGAFSFFPEGQAPVTARTARRPISPEELSRRIAERRDLPFSVWDGRVRMSIAGYQDKVPVLFEGGQFYLAEGRLASTHILKPQSLESPLPYLVANEHFCMSLARRMELAVAEVDILRVPDPVLLVRRFDRSLLGNRVARQHIIDACQALDLPVSFKYERNFGNGKDVRHIRDGISFERLFAISAYCPVKVLAKQLFLRWAILQFLIGNSDAHGKNLSFFCRSEGLSVAPFYDLVSVVHFSSVEHEMAMAYGDEFDLTRVSPYDWATFAKRIGIARSLLSREMTRMGRSAKEAARRQAQEAIYLGAERTVVNDLARFVDRQADRLIESANPMRQVDASLL